MSTPRTRNMAPGPDKLRRPSPEGVEYHPVQSQDHVAGEIQSREEAGARRNVESDAETKENSI
jgi:hypothetical protein